MTWACKALALVVVICFAGGALQAEPRNGALEQAGRFMLAEDFPAARAVAETAIPQTPEDSVEQAWIIGLSHMRENAPRAALPHLERTVTLAPQVPRFRLELARALYLTEQDARARFHFENALSGQLSLGEISAVQEYLTAMDRRRTWQGHASFAIVPQTNPTRASGESHVMVGGAIPLPLAQARRGVGMDLGLGGTWLPRLGHDLRGRVHVMANGQVFEDSRLNSWRLRNEFGLLTLGDHGQQIGAGVTLQAAFGDGGRLMEGLGVYASFQRRFGPRTHLSVRANADRLRYPGVANKAMDGWRTALSVKAMHILTPQIRLDGGVSLAKHNARADFNTRSDIGVSFGGQYAHAGGMTTGLSAAASQTQYAASNPLLPQFAPARDTNVSLTASLMHRELTMQGFAPVLHLGVERQDSNIPSRSFSNIRASIGATRNF
ncbi:surface lipoprotein assembly modifier [Roseinatronobacter alkalisoli]|uniref:Surface lipoprotein assembly modifier n=1 Tax=Roseinatronobacter alkalisoli TaxID=3028235 RepID=A0ABT5T6C9_9RHOB|nr:surface lipoprotein assembly modifier [Roseinatronobacter sp. HJB301]MDD7970536.1 surface lipoprotein assembly modifier [Roseinatronobacter sp. HJB301]